MKNTKLLLSTLLFLFLICFNVQAQNSSELKKHIIELENAENIEEAIKKALKLEKKLNKEDNSNPADKVAVLRLLSDLYDKIEKDDKIIYYCKKAVKLAKQSGRESNIYIESINYLSDSYIYLGKNEEAEKGLNEILNIQKKLNQTHTELYAYTLFLYGTLQNSYSNYEVATTYLLESKEIYEDLNLKKTIEYTDLLNEIANSYKYINKQSEAKELYETIEPILREIVGQDDELYIDNQLYRAVLLGELNQLEKATQLFEEVVQKHKDKGDTLSISYADRIHELAFLYYDAGKAEKAAPLFKISQYLTQKKYGKQNLDYLFSTHFLAMAYEYLDDPKAEELYNECYVEIQKLEGKNSINFADFASSLANFYTDKSEFEKARPYHQQAYQTAKSTVSSEHHIYRHIIINRASFYTKTNEIEKADLLYKEIIAINKSNIKNVFPILNEQEKEKFIQTVENQFKTYQSFILQFYKEKPELIKELIELNMITKGLIFQSTQKLRQNIATSKDKEMIATFQTWKDKKNKLTSAWQLSEEEQKEQKINLSKLKQEAETAESTLINLAKEKGLSGTKTLEFLNKTYSFEDLQHVLKENETLIEIIRTEEFDTKKQQFDTVYIAVLIENNSQPKLLILEEGEEMETSELMFYRNNIEFNIKESESYSTYWKQINEQLNPATKKIFFSPDGIYHKISINTLYDNEKYLIDKFQIQMISSSRDLIEFDESEKQNTNQLEKNFTDYQFYLFGYPQYNLLDQKQQDNNTNKRSFSSERFWRNGGITPLLGTKEEVETIDSLLIKSNYKTFTFLGKEANESNLKNLKSPTVLHIATHGFFRPSDNQSENDSPLRQSGLLLAGAENGVIENEKGNGEDGVLSAEEVLTFDLNETELVILSACETGLGEFRDSEGVYGLERAFKQAGAKSVIISLWKVSDEATNKMMQHFYKHWIATKDKHKAFQLAQKELRKEFPEPFYWGAFILVGE